MFSPKPSRKAQKCIYFWKFCYHLYSLLHEHQSQTVIPLTFATINIEQELLYTFKYRR